MSQNASATRLAGHASDAISVP